MPGLEVGRRESVSHQLCYIALSCYLPPRSRSQDGSVDGQPLWAMVFYCMRCGDMDDALNAVSSAQ